MAAHISCQSSRLCAGHDGDYCFSAVLCRRRWLIFGGWISDKWFQSSRKTPIIITQLIGAFCLYLTYTVTSPTMAVVYETLAGGFLYMGMGAFWALPMSIIPKTVMGTASGLINTAGQVAGFISPIAVGYLVQITGGSFNTAFMFLIVGTVSPAPLR